MIINLPTAPAKVTTYEATYEQTSNFYTTDVLSDGIFQVYFSQDPKITSAHYSSEYTLIGVFAMVGGFISLYYYLIVFTM